MTTRRHCAFCGTSRTGSTASTRFPEENITDQWALQGEKFERAYFDRIEARKNDAKQLRRIFKNGGFAKLISELVDIRWPISWQVLLLLPPSPQASPTGE